MVNLVMPLRVAVVGEESLANLRLADTLRSILGKEHVYRCLELDHLIDYITKNTQNRIIVFLDLFCFDLLHVTASIGSIRQRYPSVVFDLYMDYEDFKNCWNELPSEWAGRLDHYFRTYKQGADVEIEPLLRLNLRLAQDEAVLSGAKNIKVKSSDLDVGTSSAKSAFVPHHPPTTKTETEPTIFLSYSRTDWDSFVSGFANQLTERGYNIWVDQQFLIGGSNWMDSVGDALNKCRLLLLVVSPEALASKYVKMEYRYFINNAKIVLPVLHKSAPLPFELSETQHLDFSQANTAQSFAKLHSVLDHHLNVKDG